MNGNVYCFPASSFCGQGRSSSAIGCLSVKKRWVASVRPDMEGVVVSLSTKTWQVPVVFHQLTCSGGWQADACGFVHTNQTNVHIFESCVVVCSDGNGSFNGIHSGIAGHPFAVRAMAVVEVDLDGRLAVVGHIPHLVADLVANRLHGVGLH